MNVQQEIDEYFETMDRGARHLTVILAALALIVCNI